MADNDSESIKNNTNDQTIDKMDKPLPKWFLAIVPLYSGALIAFCLFPLAGDWLWIEGWVFVVMFAVYAFLMVYGLNKKNPRVLRNRMKIRKERKMKDEKSQKASSSDKWILPLFGISFALIFILADLDHLFNWSIGYPIWVEIVGFAILAAGLYVLYLAQVQNAYASKVLDIREGQKLIDTGLYAHVRHPLYSGFLGIIIGVSLSFGSWWSIIPAVLGVLGLILRTKYEEEMLITGLEGYKEYRQRVRYKLIPHIY